MEVVETRKRPGDDDGAGDSAAAMSKRQREVADLDVGELGDDIFAWLLVDDDGTGAPASDQLVELLDAAAAEEDHGCPSSGAAPKVRFIENPYSSPLIFQTLPSSYVTINGNEESCGSSFSDWDSSVMASVDTSGAVFAFGFGYGYGYRKDNTGISIEELEQWLNGGFEEAEMDGAWGSSEDGLELDWDNDDSLERFLVEISSEQSLD
ncbi:hypothetical protein PanWU01x14_223350 [Parasponia andersonii]|uniref:Uncharacterized protein n=1 Tax=Parasponia andersonii TaxID=3476 RepID=A0A2P5BNY1_PARAD|nr:hypothetical protein PanWU01x14_223350 [Parasponia andersonii]